MQQDTLLVRKMQNGDEEAMAVFVQKYYPRILQYCRYHCMDRESAQDLTQETAVMEKRDAGIREKPVRRIEPTALKIKY